MRPLKNITNVRKIYIFIQILSMILIFIVAIGFAGRSLLTVVPVIPVNRLIFHEQPSAFVLTLSNATKTHQNPLLWGCCGDGGETIASKG